MSEPTPENVLRYVEKEHDATRTAGAYQGAMTRTCIHVHAVGIFTVLAVILYRVNVAGFIISAAMGILALINFVVAYYAIGKFDADAVSARTIANGAREYALHPENYLHR